MGIFDKLFGKKQPDANSKPGEAGLSTPLPDEHKNPTEPDEKSKLSSSIQTVDKNPDTHVVRDDLSDSGAISIASQIDHCIQRKDWEQAEKWALHAISSGRDKEYFKVKLAEIYLEAGLAEKFTKIFEDLYVFLAEDDPNRPALKKMATQIIPEHVLIVDPID